MLIADYNSSEEYKIEDLQFVIAIALDLLGYTSIASDLLKMFSNSKDNSEENYNALVQYVDTHKSGKVYGFISALYDIPLFYKRRSSLYDKKTACRITELGVDGLCSIMDLYGLTIKLVTANKVNDFILLYMDTKMWRTTFNRVAVTNFASRDDDTVNELHAAFKKFIAAYSSDGQYATISRNPNAFLVNTYNSYFKLSAEYKDIMKNVSLLGSTSSDDARSLVDRYLDDNDFDEDAFNSAASVENIDFIGIARKIYECSYSLFNFSNDHGVAFYDIFSWYRSTKVNEIKTKNAYRLGRLRKIYTVSYVDNKESFEGNRAIKLSARKPVCEELSYVLDNGIAMKDIYQFWLRVNHTAEQQDNGKDGRALYYGTKDNNVSAKFQKHYEGFLALRDLVDYLSVNGATLGVSIFNFPTEIFRDKRLLTRFSNLQEYIALHKDVISLIDEVAKDPVRSLARDENQLLSNDLVYEKMLELSSKAGDKSFDRLLFKAKAISLGAIAGVDLASETDRFSQTIIKPLYDFLQVQQNDLSYILPEQDYERPKLYKSPEQGLILLIYLARKVYTAIKSYPDKYMLQKNYALAFVKQLDELLCDLGAPIEKNGISKVDSLTIEDLLNAAQIPDSTITLPKEFKPVNVFSTLVNIFKVSAQIICDKSSYEEVSVLNTFNLARVLNSLLTHLEKTRGVVKSADSLKRNVPESEYHGLLNQIAEVRSFDENKQNYFLCYAYMVHTYPMISMSLPIKNITQVNNYMYRVYVVSAANDFSGNMTDALENLRKKNIEVLDEINTYLSYYQPLFSVFEEFYKLSKKSLRVVGDVSNIDATELQILKNLNIKISAGMLEPGMGSSKTKYYNILKAKCAKYDCHFDGNGFLMKGLRYLKLNNKYFVHEYGYKVDTGMHNIIVEPSISVLNDYDVDCTLEQQMR